MKTTSNILLELNDKVYFNNLSTDYKAEVVALNLIKKHKEIDYVFLKRLGSNNRTFKKDVNKILTKLFDFDETIVSIETYRESIYDYLPEGVFHKPTLGKIYDNIDQIIEQIQVQRKIEEDARKFFEPFELESYFTELAALDLESQYDILDGSYLLKETIAELWPLLDELDPETANIFIYLLPFFHTVRGNKKWFEKCLMAFLKIPVNITFIPNVIKNTDEISIVLESEDPQLGISTIINGNHFDGQQNWCINFGPIPYDVLDQYVPQSNLRKLLRRLYDYCVPLNIEIVEEFTTEKKEESFRLSSEQNTSILGYSTFI